MNRYLTYFVGPETVLTLLSLGVFWFCARHNTGEGRDILIMEQIVMLMPFVVVPLVFATVFIPGAKTWWWLGRAISFTFLMLIVCGCRAISGFGTGAKGQDAAFMLIILFGTVAVSLATSVTGALILAEVKPAFGDWFRARRIIGSVLTLASSVPIGFIVGITVVVCFSLFAAAWTSFKR